VRFVKIAAPDLGARNMRGNRQHRYTRTVTVEQAVDQMQVTGAATAGADRELAGEMGLGAGGERRGFLMPGMNPVDIAAPPQRFRDAVEAIADHTVDAADTNRM